MHIADKEKVHHSFLVSQRSFRPRFAAPCDFLGSLFFFFFFFFKILLEMAEARRSFAGHRVPAWSQRQLGSPVKLDGLPGVQEVQAYNLQGI